MTMQPSSNLELVQGAYEAFNRGDVPAVLDLMDEDVVWRDMDGFPYGGTYHGPDAVLDNVFKKIGEEWNVWQSTPEEYIDGGDTVVALGEYNGTYAETGKSMRAPFAHVWTIRNGKVHKFRQYADTVLIQQALEEAEASSAA